MIFVFGSNYAGRHGKGAALTAARHHGAVAGQGVGLWGNSYAIPTKDVFLKTLSIEEIATHVGCFVDYATNNPDLKFQITRIGCGLAGYKDEEIAPLFDPSPSQNCFFDTAWRPFLGNGYEYWGSFNSSS